MLQLIKRSAKFTYELLTEGAGFAIAMSFLAALAAWIISFFVRLPIPVGYFALTGGVAGYAFLAVSVANGYGQHRKIHSTKFDSERAAHEYADKAGWHYIGRAGLTRQYADYCGWYPNRDGFSDIVVWDNYHLRIHAEGATELWSTCVTGCGSATSLPERVHPSNSLTGSQ